MPSVGPELPPHLAKRKRSTDDEAPDSPPRKVQAATAPPPRTLGPTMPPTSNPDELDLGGNAEVEYGLSAFKPATSPSQRSTPPKKRIFGPAPPPANLSERPSHPADESSDSDDEFGPSLPPAPGSAAESALLAQQEEEKEQSVAAAAASARPRRAEWMLAPPTDSDMSERVDPTKLKNRKFASGKGAKATAETSGISAIWTETPEEKRQRLEDEVLGRKDAATGSRGGGTKKEISKELEREEQATAKRIEEYNEKNRGKSLFEEREKLRESKGGKVEDDDDPSQRGFDREKDMALGGRLGLGQKREMLAKAADFGSRFQKGRYL
ncbi:hypothetical protein PZA11_004415 [Diplocarpon coronariae]|uniref:DUF3752 domain-containing protein n=1 Tax=Diplocarpon coronariae TaxID=2795749 RepID=A0A218YT22_9HELO|nr:hypothetical protein B2J93_9129 [Marssonina coronariae]